MACESLVDWRGKPINTKVHGGVRAAWYLYFLIVVNFLVHVPNLQNMTTYLREVMHMKVSDASTTLTNFIGAMCGFALLGGFLSDSYITCARTILLSVPLVILVFVVAFKNRKLELPEKMEETQQNNSLKFLDKACVKTNTGGQGDGPWSCSAAKVEETKIVLRMLPLVFSSTVAHVSSSLLIAFTVQQGATTNTKLGKVHVYPAMLFIIPSIFQTLMLVAYDRLLVPLLPL